MKYLVDTNVLSEPVKNVPSASVMKKLAMYQHKIVTCTVVCHELLFGCLRLPISRKREAVESYLNDVVFSTVPVLSYDFQAAKWHAEERARLMSIGRTPSFADGQIAAIAGVNGLILVTRNVSDFEVFSGLSLENWHGE